MDELQAHEPMLRDLNMWFRGNANRFGIKSQAYYETKKTFGVQVVDQTSADPGIPDVIPIPLG
jgi:hypothetical protein